MGTILQRIAEIESEMARTQKNKATSAHLGMLKARLAKLRRELITPKGGGGGPGEGFDVAKTGDARIGFVGFPSVGKSTLLSNLAGVYSEVAAYEFTTLTTVPGVIRYKGAKIQLLDLPGIIEGAKDGKGRGRQVIAVARTCSLILIVLDVLKPLQHKKIIEKEVEGFGIRLNKQPPNITIKRKEKGGINLVMTCNQTYLDVDLVKTILSEYKIPNADVTLRCDATEDDLIDAVEGNRVYIPCIYVLNKIDQISIQELDIIYKIPHCVPISAHHKWNFDDLLEKIWDYLHLIRIDHSILECYNLFSGVELSMRSFLLFQKLNCGFFGSPFAPIQHASDFSRLSLREEYTSNVSQGSNTNASDLASGVRKSASSAYTKPKGQLPDYETPVVLHDNRSTVEDFCNNLHKSIMKEFKYGLVWGSSVKHNPQKVGKDHQLQDEDVVQVVKRV